MAREIEQLLRVMGDLHRFSEGNSTVSCMVSEELFEDSLELISAAAYEPIDRNALKRKAPNDIG